MEKNKRDLWFRAKNYGWGWYPSSWQGWTVIAGYFLLVLASAVFLVEEAIGIRFPIAIFILSSILVLISYLKGEKPGWRWGNSNFSKIKKINRK